MVFKKLCRSVGLTEEIRTELSDVLYDRAVVSKDHQPEDDQTGTGIAIGLTTMDNIGDGIVVGAALGRSMSKDEEYNIRFKGDIVTIDLNNEQIFGQFNNGDTVRLAYRKAQRVTFDYVPPHFEQKQELNRFLSGYRFVSAEKI